MRPVRFKPVSSEAILAASIFVGIAVPPLARLLEPLLYAFVFFLMLFSALAINLKNALPDRQGFGRLAAVLGWQMLLLPALIGVGHGWVPVGGRWSELMFLTACAGTIFGAPAFARVMRLDALLTLRGVLAATLLMPLILPVLVPLVTQRTAEFDLPAYAARFFIFIVLPLAAAFLYQTRSSGIRPARHRLFDRLTIVFLSLFGIAVMDGIGARFVEQPLNTLGMLGFALAVHGAFFGLSFLIFLQWGYREALTAGLLSGYRNLALLLAVGGSLLPPDFIVFVALWQIPMYLTPLLVKQLGGRRDRA